MSLGKPARSTEVPFSINVYLTETKDWAWQITYGNDFDYSPVVYAQPATALKAAMAFANKYYTITGLA